MKRFVVLLAALVFAAVPGLVAAKSKAPAAPAKSLPTYFTIPAALKIAPGSTFTEEDFGQATFWVQTNGQDEKVDKQGKHWEVALIYNGAPKAATGKDVWALIKPSVVAGGWTIPVEYDENPFSAMMRYQKDGKDVWAYMKLFAPDDIRLNIVEVGGPSAPFVLTPPAATPEKIDARKGDFPYLTPLPGSTYKSGGQDKAAMTLELPGSSEPQVVGTGSITKFYAPPPGLSNLSFIQSYSTAMTAAGWKVIYKTPGASGTDSTLTAHYSQNGRNIWVYMHNMTGSEYSIQVSDAGSQSDMAADLAKQCHIALYGVFFDFNKSTLKPESDPVLQEVAGFLSKDAALKIEVQGHTDNVGSDSYNQTLSESRAKSVMAWLTQHGVAANRLSFKGYGKTMPVATNDTDEGRAKNRRVEIANPACKPSK